MKFMRHGSTLGALGTLCVLAVLRGREFLPGRFWAEEGTTFFPLICKRPVAAGLAFLHNGHLELLGNAVVLLATKVAFELAPAVTTWLSAALGLVFFAGVWARRQALGLTPIAWLTWVLAVFGLPQTEEVWANSANLHFHGALVAALLLLEPSRERESPARLLVRGLGTAACGLSGVPAALLAPVAAVQALRRRTLPDVVNALALGLAAVVQLALLVTHAFAERPVVKEGWPLLLSLLSQLVVSPTLGYSGEAVVEVLRSAPGGAPVGVAAALLSLALLAGLFVTILRDPRTRLLGVCAGISLVGIVGSVGDPWEMVSVGNNGRYFFVPLTLLLLALASRASRGRFRVEWVVLLVVTLHSLGTGFALHNRGVRWSDSLKVSRERASDTVEIWPAGWHMYRLERCCASGDCGP